MNPRRMKSSDFILLRPAMNARFAVQNPFLLTWHEMISYQFETKSQQMKSNLVFVEGKIGVPGEKDSE